MDDAQQPAFDRGTAGAHGARQHRLPAKQALFRDVRWIKTAAQKQSSSCPRTRKPPLLPPDLENKCRPKELGRHRSGLFALGFALLMFLQNALLENIGSLEGHHASRKNWYFFAGLRIATDTFVLVADLKSGK